MITETSNWPEYKSWTVPSWQEIRFDLSKSVALL